MKGENAFFYPNIGYHLNPEIDEKLDLRTKKPLNIEGMGLLSNPMQEDGG